MLRMYAVAKNDRLKTAGTGRVFSGGKSDAIWHVTLDFGALGLQNIRQMWLTFAPPLANGKAFEDHGMGGFVYELDIRPDRMT